MVVRRTTRTIRHSHTSRGCCAENNRDTHVFLLGLVAVLPSTPTLMQCRALYIFASSSAFSISVLSLRCRRLAPHSFTPSRYSVFPPHVCTCTHGPLHATLISHLHELKLSPPSFVHGGAERRPYVPLAYRYALVVVFNEYASYESVRSTMTAATTTAMVVAGVTTTATATAMMTAAWSNSEFTDLVTTARIMRLAFFKQKLTVKEIQIMQSIGANWSIQL